MAIFQVKNEQNGNFLIEDSTDVHVTSEDFTFSILSELV